MRLCAILTVFLLPGTGIRTSIAARVTDPTGRPLADVRVIGWLGEEVRTDETGQFRLSRPAQLVRFSRERYQPLTLPSGAIKADVVLHLSTTGSWEPPVCEQAAAEYFGEAMRFSSPPGVRLETSTDVDYSTTSLRYEGATLRYGTGPHWTYGLPNPEVLSEMTEVQERDVATPGSLPAAEYRGQRRDGTHWRQLLMLGESIGYDRASAKAAAYFDRIIDSLCFKRRDAPEQGPADAGDGR